MNDWYQPIPGGSGKPELLWLQGIRQESFNSNYESASGREIPQQLPMATLTRISLGRFRRTKEGHRIPMAKPHIHLNPMAPAARPKLSLGRFRPNMTMDRTVQTSRRTQQPSWLFSWSAPAYATFILVRPGGGGHTAADHHFRSLHWAFHLFDLGQR